MNTFIEDQRSESSSRRWPEQFAAILRQSILEARDLDAQLDPGRLEAFKQNPDDESYRRIELPGAPERERGASGGGPRFNHTTRRVLLVALLVIAVGAVAPFVWNYLQSYESTDDAQIDGHIDPLSSRIDGTVIRVHAEDDDRVKAGELLVEIDPRDYEVAVAQAKARLELALARVASAKQDYAAALANVREGNAANFKAQRDAQRYAILLDQQVVAQEQYDQYTRPRASIRRKSIPTGRPRAPRSRRSRRAKRTPMRPGRRWIRLCST